MQFLTTQKSYEIRNESFQSGKQCFIPVSSALTAFLDPDRQAPLMPLFLNNNCPYMAPCKSPIHASSTFVDQNSSIQENLNVGITQNGCDFFQQQVNGMISGGNFTSCSFNFSFKKIATVFTKLLQGINNLNSNFVQ